jgi:hypothetical protein
MGAIFLPDIFLSCRCSFTFILNGSSNIAFGSLDLECRPNSLQLHIIETDIVEAAVFKRMRIAKEGLIDPAFILTFRVE